MVSVDVTFIIVIYTYVKVLTFEFYLNQHVLYIKGFMVYNFKMLSKKDIMLL